MKKEKEISKSKRKILHIHKHSESLKLIHTAKGHLEGIEKMINEDRYCIDISRQLLAVISILRKANSQVLKKHMETCVINSKGTENLKEKLGELEAILEYVMKGS
jgi:DNA-binding FrmR family transcriptional regulator